MWNAVLGIPCPTRRNSDNTIDSESLPSSWVCHYENESTWRYVRPSGLTCDEHPAADKNCIVRCNCGSSCFVSCLGGVMLNLDLSGSSSSSVSPWDHPRAALKLRLDLHVLKSMRRHLACTAGDGIMTSFAR